MKRRWKLWVSLTLLTVCILSLPPVHWRIIGWVRREAFYLGRPTSYWEGEVARLEPHCPMMHFSYFFLPDPSNPGSPFGSPFGGLGGLPPAAPTSGWLPGELWDSLKEKFWPSRSPLEPEGKNLPGWLILYGEDPLAVRKAYDAFFLQLSQGPPPPNPFALDDATLPVKRELLKSDHAFVRCLVLRFLHSHALKESDQALVKEALHDPILDVRLEAAFCLMLANPLGDAPDEMLRSEANVYVTMCLQMQPFAAVACFSYYLTGQDMAYEPVGPIFVEGLKHPDPGIRGQCAGMLAGCGSAAKPAVPALLAALAEVRKEGAPELFRNHANACVTMALQMQPLAAAICSGYFDLGPPPGEQPFLDALQRIAPEAAARAQRK